MKLTWRDVYDVQGRVMPWLAPLGNASGVYVIRHRITGEPLYVGESHTGRLRKTLLRHFQAWKADSFKREHHTYAPRTVEVAIIKTGSAGAVRTQNKLIAALDPRDNLQ